jgi:hypothetical protein
MLNMERIHSTGVDGGGSNDGGAEFMAETAELARRLSIVSVVLAGGAGTRLWPLSREHYPKQLINMIGTHSLLQETVPAGEAFKGVAVPLIAGWSDLGAWDAVWAAFEKDEAGNVARGRVLFEGATSSYAHSEGRLVACVGTTNVVVETADAVLVADRPHVQDIKRLVARSQGAPSVGLLRIDRSRRALPGQAPRRRPRRPALPAVAPSSRRTLGGSERHGTWRVRRGALPAQRKRVDLHPARRASSAGEPRQGAARNHRGSTEPISGKTTSCALTTPTAAAIEEKLARVRLFMCSTHTAEHIDIAIDALARINGGKSGEPSRFGHLRTPAARKASLYGKRTKFCIREFSLVLFPNPKPLILFIVQCG